jgi:hypothetical protein
VNKEREAAKSELAHRHAAFTRKGSRLWQASPLGCHADGAQGASVVGAKSVVFLSFSLHRIYSIGHPDASAEERIVVASLEREPDRMWNSADPLPR